MWQSWYLSCSVSTVSIITGRSRIGSNQRGETLGQERVTRGSGVHTHTNWEWCVHSHELSPWTSSGGLWGRFTPVGHWDDGWRLFVRRRVRTVSPTVSLTPSPSLNPKMTLSKFLRNLSLHGGYPFLYYYITSSHLCNVNMLFQGIPNLFR